MHNAGYKNKVCETSTEHNRSHDVSVNGVYVRSCGPGLFSCNPVTCHDTCKLPPRNGIFATVNFAKGEGIDNVRDAPFIVANHQSYLDGALVATELGHPKIMSTSDMKNVPMVGGNHHQEERVHGRRKLSRW